MVQNYISKVLIIFLAMLIATSPVFSQKKTKKKKAAEPPLVEEQVKKPRLKTLPPAYNDKMLRLAEILGSMHYLRELCGAKEEMKWREQMEIMLASEDPTEKRKAELIGRFNRGFRTFSEIHAECTSTAMEAANLYLRQGTKLAGEIPNRYGR